MDKRVDILILLKHSGVEKTSAFLEIVKILNDKNIHVDVIVASSSDDTDSYYYNADNITYTVLNKTRIVSIEKKYYKKFKQTFLCQLMIKSYAYFKLFRKWLKYMHLCRSDSRNSYTYFLNDSMKKYRTNKKYDYIWVVDEYGLLWAKYLFEKCNISSKVIYHCLELYWENYPQGKKNHWKEFEGAELIQEARRALENVELVIIQDEMRWKVLREYTGLPEKMRKIFFPVSIYDYKFDNDRINDTKVVLKDGMKSIFYPTLLEEKRGCIRLVHMAEDLGKEFEVVIHGFSGDRQYIEKIKRLAQNNSAFSFSNYSLNYEELLILHQKIWCVFLYYGEENNNDAYIANSSNKLVMALQAGKPIITIGNHSLHILCEEYKCGISLRTWSKEELNRAVNILKDNYYEYSENAYRCYKERFDSKLYADNLLQEILK